MHAAAVEMTTPGLTDREREFGAIIKAYSDVTERLMQAHESLHGEVSRLRDELGRKNAELRRRERLAALGEMAAGLAHEIRNPLGGIALYASMLEQTLAGHADAGASARKISEGVRSLDRLVGEILDFAQEDRLERQPCQLGGILAEVDAIARPWADRSGARASFDDRADELWIDADPLRLRQVLTNLVINGLQAAGEGGQVQVNARYRQVPPPGHCGEVQIEVLDSGPGIPADMLDRIFNPFFTTKPTGTGLGLAIVHRIVEAHGGTIRATNRPEGGARFAVTIPPAGSRQKAEQERGDLSIRAACDAA